MMADWLLWAWCASSALFLIGVCLTHLYHRNAILRMADLPPEPPPGGWPRLAAIFAARDEQAEVEAATRSLLAQGNDRFELIAVDDRSSDATGAILDAIAAEDPRLRVIHVATLPDGWLGKTHALELAARSTTADWLLFTDADVHFASGAVERAVALAERTGLDHVVVAPSVPTQTLGERLFMSIFLLCFAVRAPAWRVANPACRTSVGVGAFNLVRRAAFLAVGGFRNLSLSVDDDLRLGEALKAAGYQPLALDGDGCVSVRWHVGAPAMIRGLEKNFFGAINYRLAAVPVILFGIIWVSFGSHVGICLGVWSVRVVCAGGIVALALLLNQLGRACRVAWYHALLFPIAGCMLGWALVRSTALTLWRGGITWRGHLYPLAALKAHVRWRDRWLAGLWKATR